MFFKFYRSQNRWQKFNKILPNVKHIHSHQNQKSISSNIRYAFLSFFMSWSCDKLFSHFWSWSRSTIGSTRWWFFTTDLIVSTDCSTSCRTNWIIGTIIFGIRFIGFGSIKPVGQFIWSSWSRTINFSTITAWTIWKV